MLEEKSIFSCLFGVMVSYGYMLSLSLTQIVIGNLNDTSQTAQIDLIFLISGGALLLFFILNALILKNRPTLRMIKGNNTSNLKQEKNESVEEEVKKNFKKKNFKNNQLFV